MNEKIMRKLQCISHTSEIPSDGYHRADLPLSSFSWKYLSFSMCKLCSFMMISYHQCLLIIRHRASQVILPFSFFSYYQNSATTPVTNSRVFWQQQLSNLINEWIKMIIFTEWEHPVLHFYSNCAPEEYHWVYYLLPLCLQALSLFFFFPHTILTLQAPKSYCMHRHRHDAEASKVPSSQLRGICRYLCCGSTCPLKLGWYLKVRFPRCICKPELYIKVGD